MRKSSIRRQKTRPLCQETENQTDPTPQYFQITVDVMEARKLAWTDSHSLTSYVVVVLGKNKQRTNIRQNTADPSYRECFVFELYTTNRDLQHSNVWLAVMEPRCCGPPNLLGQADINLGAIWAQPNHKVFHKWANLTLPQDPNAGLVGFLKVDITITFKEEDVQQALQIRPLSMEENNLDDDILLPSGMEQTRANYVITIYGAFALPSGPYSYGEKRYGKPPSTYVRISFCGLTAKTAVQNANSHPTYNELVSFIEMFPNTSQEIRMEVCSAEGNKVIASTHLRVNLVSHHGENGFLPTFGPSLLHMYGNPYSGPVGYTSEDGPCHRGALLVALKTVVPFYQQGLRTTSIEPAPPIKTRNLWLLEDFCVICPIFEVSMLDRRIAGKSCGVAITIGETFTDVRGNDEFPPMLNEIKLRKLHYTGSMDVATISSGYGYLDFPHGFPVLQLGTRLPDITFRMYRNNMVQGIIFALESILIDVQTRLKSSNCSIISELLDVLNKALDDTALSILKFLDIIQCMYPSSSSANVQRCYTELDQRQLALQRDEMKRIHNQLSIESKTNSLTTMGLPLGKAIDDICVSNRKAVKVLLAKSRDLIANLRNLIFKSPEGWPNIVVWLLNAGSRVAYCRISPTDIIDSEIPVQNGRTCGRIQTIYFKPLKCPKHPSGVTSVCNCIAGKVELLFWMSIYRQNIALDKYLPAGYKLKIREYDMALKCSTAMVLECRCFLYRAKLNISMENNFAYTFFRMHALCSVAETKLKQEIATPIWNEVLRIRKVVLTTNDRLCACPPTVLLEVYGNELSGKHELIGCLEVKPTIDDRLEFEYAPKLQWHDVKKGEEYIGQVLMSVQIVQIPEKIMKTTVYSPLEESVYAENIKELSSIDDIVPLPATLIPQSMIYKVDIYWWGLRDVIMTRKPCVALETDELTVKSDIISVTKPNCNFPNGRMSQVFEAPLYESYCSPLNIKLYDSNTFGRTSFVGSHVIKNPNKYVINWIGLSERGSIVNTASITSSNFVQVTQTLCIMKRHSTNIGANSAVPSIKSYQSTAKMSKWRRLFGNNVPNEEEYVLLPMATKEMNNLKVLNKKTCHRDWWHRYFNANKETVPSDEDSNSDRITIYSSELESQPEFSKFKDWCATLKFYNGVKSGIPEKDNQRYCGSLKAGIAIYKWDPPVHTAPVTRTGVDLTAGYFADHPSNVVNKFFVRVYIVKGTNLLGSDFTGTSNAYIMINCGKNVLGVRLNYVPNTANPTFGKLFEFRCTVPDEYLLTISLYDYESILPDELIGKTIIDLENRIYTKHRACIGLSSEYNLTGASKWRDTLKPSEILEEICAKNHLAKPIYPDVGTVVVNGVEYKDVDQGLELDGLLTSESKEKICLSILHKWHTLPLCGYHLVPEHVETRTLYNPDKPGVDQGQIQMWVDIFPLGNGVIIPRPVDIAPKVEEFELRVVIWSVFRVNQENNNNFKNSVATCVTAWLGCVDQMQSTDICCTNVKEETSFNWRLIFNFFYRHAENMLHIKEKGPFTEFEERLPPVLVFQVIDNDDISPRHCFESLSLNLTAFPRGEVCSQDCLLDKAEQEKIINLFDSGSIRGWWPLDIVNSNIGTNSIQGAIDLEMILLPKEKALLIPAGLGREPPSPLPEPKYQETIPYELISKYISSVGPRCFKLTLVLVVAMILILLVIFLELPIISLKYWFSDADILSGRSRPIRTLCKL